MDALPPLQTSAVMRRVQRLRNRFEAAWKEGDRPSAADFLLEADGESRPWLLGQLLRLELAHCRRGAGAAGGLSFAGLLRSVWPFSELPAETLRAVLNQVEERPFEPGDVLIRQGRPSRRLLILVEGVLTVGVEEQTHCYEIARLEGGAVVGEMGLLTGTPCTATVSALTPGCVLVLPAARYRRLANQYPVLRSALGHLVASRLGQDAVDPLVGKILGGYRIGRCVGRGGMATVYEAQPLAGGRRVALKMMSHRFVLDLAIQKRFDREVEICRSLRHANIARILGRFTSFGTNFMVMEFCAGRTLHQVVRQRGPLPEEQVRKIVGQLARALHYTHSRGVCHRDLKPQNIMVGPKGKVKLMDFGLAKSTASAELTNCNTILGTPGYMAPEQISGAAVDCRADLFALGCVIYEMLQGWPLFSGSDVVELLRQHMAWSLPPADQIRLGLSPDIYQALRETLVLEPASRVLDLARLGEQW